MTKCPFCDHNNSEDANFCGKCNIDLREEYSEEEIKGRKDVRRMLFSMKDEIKERFGLNIEERHVHMMLERFPGTFFNLTMKSVVDLMKELKESKTAKPKKDIETEKLEVLKDISKTLKDLKRSK